MLKPCSVVKHGYDRSELEAKPLPWQLLLSCCHSVSTAQAGRAEGTYGHCFFFFFPPPSAFFGNFGARWRRHLVSKQSFLGARGSLARLHHSSGFHRTTISSLPLPADRAWPGNKSSLPAPRAHTSMHIRFLGEGGDAMKSRNQDSIVMMTIK